MAKIPYPDYYFAFNTRPTPPYVRQVETGVAFEIGFNGEVESLTKDLLERKGGTGPYMRYEHSGVPISRDGFKAKVLKKWQGKADLSDFPNQSNLTTYATIETRVPELKSSYGVVWRGINRPFDREMGIAGGETIVLDLKTNEILAISRGFAIVGYERKASPNFIWGPPLICPNEKIPSVLVTRTLIPPTPTQP